MLENSSRDRESPSARIRAAALGLGFARVGITSAEPFDVARGRLEGWLNAGFQADLTYMSGPGDRANAAALLPTAKSVVVVALPYRGAPVALRRSRTSSTALVGEIARYAVGTDYHLVLKDKLEALAKACRLIAGRDVDYRTCVDTAPFLEREASRRAGVGFIGKSTMTIAPGLGTYFMLGELLIDLELERDAPVDQGCGRCTACLDVCPTGAFVGPYVLDARRCISYLTIENKGPIPRELRALVGTRVFGCDVCQDVCPWNGSDATRPVTAELEARPSLDWPELVPLLELRSNGYRQFVKRSALRRIGRDQIKRNAAVALGNTADVRAVPPLAKSLAGDRSAMVRAHAAWALGRIGGEDAKKALETAAERDADESVRDEARAALDFLERDAT